MRERECVCCVCVRESVFACQNGGANWRDKMGARPSPRPRPRLPLEPFPAGAGPLAPLCWGVFCQEKGRIVSRKGARGVKTRHLQERRMDF